VINKRIPKQMRDDIFTGKFAQLNTKKSYSFKDLEQDADGIVKVRCAGEGGESLPDGMETFSADDARSQPWG
jgi:hypothetical protein